MTDTSEIFEPTAYFEELKGKLNSAQLADFENQITAISDQIITAKKLGQTNMLHRLSFVYQTILKEKALLVNGVDRYLYKDDIVRFIEKVVPARSVKIIELERFPRVIPDANAAEILRVRPFFDNICVVYTDFTDAEHKSLADTATVARNKDPIAFGYFQNAKAGLRHDRYYFITDWEDEFCDLTLTRMVEEMGRMGIHNPVKTIAAGPDYVNSIVRDALEEAENTTRVLPPPAPTPSETNFFTRFIGLIRGSN